MYNLLVLTILYVKGKIVLFEREKMQENQQNVDTSRPEHTLGRVILRLQINCLLWEWQREPWGLGQYILESRDPGKHLHPWLQEVTAAEGGREGGRRLCW